MRFKKSSSQQQLPDPEYLQYQDYVNKNMEDIKKVMMVKKISARDIQSKSSLILNEQINVSERKNSGESQVKK